MSLNIKNGFPVFATIIEANNIVKKDLIENNQLTENDRIQIQNLAKDDKIGEKASIDFDLTLHLLYFSLTNKSNLNRFLRVLRLQFMVTMI